MDDFLFNTYKFLGIYTYTESYAEKIIDKYYIKLH